MESHVAFPGIGRWLREPPSDGDIRIVPLYLAAHGSPFWQPQVLGRVAPLLCMQEWLFMAPCFSSLHLAACGDTSSFFEKLFLPPRIMGHFKRLVAGYPALVRFTQLFELFYPFPFHATCHMQRDIHAIMIFPSLFFCPVPLGIYSPSPPAFQVSF